MLATCLIVLLLLLVGSYWLSLNSLTNNGENACLYGVGFANKATKLKLYTSSSVPIKAGVEGTDFFEVANGNGYTTGGIAVTSGSFTYSVVAGTGQVVMAGPFTWTATGTIANVAGAYLTDSSNNILAWWSRPALSILSGDTLTFTNLTITG